MSNISKYNDFILESKFNNIIDEIFLLVESEGKWLDDRTVVWEFDTKNKKSIVQKLKSFLSKLPKEKIKEYFFKLLKKFKSLPEKIRKRLIISYSFVFLSLVPINYLTPTKSSGAENEFKEELMIIKSEISRLSRKSSFEEAQEIVKLVEGGYSSDRKDKGNFVNTKWGKRFVGTKYGISAPVLMDYLNRIPTVDDMKKLTYETALEIYKKKYWDKQNISNFCNQSISNIIYDGCVNQGVGAMKSILRKVYNRHGLNIKDSENPFDVSFIGEINKVDPEKLFNDILEERKSRYESADTYKTHGDGWLNRLYSINFFE
jgi:lysozyme family protein